MESLATLDASGHVTNNVAKVFLALWIALVVKGSKRLDQRDAGLDHRGKLAGKENQVGFLDRPGFLLRLGGCGLLLERKHHQPAAHEAGHCVVLIEGVLYAGNDL